MRKNEKKTHFCRSFEGIVVQFDSGGSAERARRLFFRRSWLFWRNISFVKWLRAHSSVWLAILFTLCVCNLLISDRSMPQNQCNIVSPVRLQRLFFISSHSKLCAKLVPLFFSTLIFFSCVFLFNVKKHEFCSQLEATEWMHRWKKMQTN